jgi:uncharacterized protein (AIM24 family)
MASTINGTSTGNGGLISTGDDSGILNIQTNETTAITVDASQIVSYTNNLGTVAGYPAYQCRAWVNFDGTGTVAIRGSGNVTSITDNGTGDYTVNFTTAMPDINYAVSAWNNNPMGTLGSGTSLRCGGMQYEVSRTASAFRNVTFAYVGSSNTGTAEDINAIYVSIFR